MWWWLELLATRGQQNPIRECQASGSLLQQRQLPTEGAVPKEVSGLRGGSCRGESWSWGGDVGGCPMTLLTVSPSYL